MLLIRKLFRTMWQYKSQFISMIIMTTLGIGIFVAFNVEWFTIDKNTKTFFEETGYADFRIITARGFTDEQFKKVEDVYGKSNATRYSEINARIENGGDCKYDMLGIVVTTNEEVSGFLLKQGEEYSEKDENGIWISEKYAILNGIDIKDEIEISYNGRSIKLVVKGLVQSGEKMICVRDETQIMPDYDTFGYAYISPVIYEDFIGMEYYPQIHVLSDDGKEEFIAKINDEIGDCYMTITMDESVSFMGSQGEVEEGKIMGSVLPVLFLLISVLTMVTTMHRIANKEQTQIGTLKALGFKNRKILIHYTLYATIVGVFASCLGLILGYVLAYTIINPDGSMGMYLEMPYWKLRTPGFIYLVMMCILALLVMVGLTSVYKILSKPASEILRPSLGGTAKPMKIESTKWFHKRSFGTRWNLRDAIHHKSRTAMSLVGVVGCMIILLASFGINDSMTAALDLQYDGVMQYSSKVFLSADIDQEQTENLIDKYNADWGSSIGIKLDDKAIALEVYDVSNDLVRFIDQDEKFVEIGDEGAYICKRISDEFELVKGDKFTVQSYADDKEYTLEVAGVLTSMAKNIVITGTYANAVGIPFDIDALYTSEEDVDIQDGIKSVQSKEDLVGSFDAMLEIMDIMIIMLVIVGLILSVVVLYNLGVMGYTERYREMATLKVLGFRNKKISLLLIGQNLWLSLIGIVIGIPVGNAVLEYMLVAMASEYEMTLYISSFSYIISVALNVGVSLLVSLMVSRKNKNIDMVEALKISE